MIIPRAAKPGQDAIAGGARPGRTHIRPAGGGGVGQGGQEGRLAEAQLGRFLAEIQPGRGGHAFDIAAVWGDIEVDLQ